MLMQINTKPSMCGLHVGFDLFDYVTGDEEVKRISKIGQKGRTG